MLENGQYKLSGVDFDSEFVRIILDGIVYEFEEDPDDGYRSYMRGPEIVEKEVKNTFPEVLVRLVTDSNVSSNFEGIELFDAITKEEVLTIGTDYSDEWYPTATYMWRPENLVINQGKN